MHACIYKGGQGGLDSPSLQNSNFFKLLYKITLYEKYASDPLRTQITIGPPLEKLYIYIYSFRPNPNPTPPHPHFEMSQYLYIQQINKKCITSL